MPARLVISSILAALLVASPAAAKLRVVATVPDLAAIALAVGGKRVQVDSLSTPHQDPHFVDARPHLMLKLNRADLLLVIGLQLEVGWLPVLLTGARNGKIQPGNEGYFDCSTEVQLRQVPQVRIDRSMGDIHPGGNPHYLLHPGNALQLARAVAARMGRLDPEGRKAYQANLKTFSEALQRAHKRWKTRMTPFHGTQVVAFHNAWVYFAEAMGLQIIDYLEPKPGIPPSPAHLLKLIRRMRAAKVPLIVCKSYYPDRATRLVANKTGATLVRIPGGTHFEKGETYLQRMERVITLISAALQARAKGSQKG